MKKVRLTLEFDDGLYQLLEKAAKFHEMPTRKFLVKKAEDGIYRVLDHPEDHGIEEPSE